jgi:hypothetical protein
VARPPFSNQTAKKWPGHPPANAGLTVEREKCALRMCLVASSSFDQFFLHFLSEEEKNV